MSNRTLAFWFSFAAGMAAMISGYANDPAMLGPALFAALQAIQYIGLQICDAIEKSGKDAA